MGNGGRSERVWPRRREWERERERGLLALTVVGEMVFWMDVIGLRSKGMRSTRRDGWEV